MRHVLIVGICGSLRRDSWNRKLLTQAKALLPDEWAYEDLFIGDLPLINEDLEGSGWPAIVGKLRARISEADGMLIATPEYNYSIPAPLKNAIDWISRPEAAAFGFHNAKGPEDFANPFIGKKTGVIGATLSPSGTARAQMALRSTLQYPQAAVMLSPEVFVATAPEKFGPGGVLTDPSTAQALAQYMQAFILHVGG